MENLEKTLDMYTESFKMKYDSFLTGCDAIEELGQWDKEAHGEMEAFYSNDLISVIIRLIATDGVITRKEVEYLNETFSFDYTQEELTEIYKSSKEDIGHAFDETFENGIAYMRKINSKLADAYKELLGLVCAIIICSDGIIAESEVAEVKRLKALCD
ncbi:MAG: TerB family tellurite resistance protein [Oscillospiraceae bacterium]|nr:TerB family tellurite resistance protein [Oscillospiraceae bacterium]